MLGQEAHGPLAAEGHQQAIPEILQNGGAGAQHKVLRRAGAVGDEPQMVVGQAGHIQVHAVFVLHAVFEHVELQCADDAYDHFLQARTGNFEDLDGTLLGDLLRALDELLALHGVLGGHPHEVLRLEGGDAGVFELLAGNGNGVADGEQARVEHADNVAGVGLFHNFPLGGHHLLRLAQPQLLAGLHMVIFGVPLELAGANPHEGQPVPVGLVHVGLNFEDEGGEILAEYIHLALVGNTGQGRGSHT